MQNLIKRIRAFNKIRDWDKFHSPKNLSMALAKEAGELLEHFQWLTQKESFNPKPPSEIEMELADIFIYLLNISDKLNVDLITAANKKLDINNQKYPIDLCKGNAQKYTEFSK